MQCLRADRGSTDLVEFHLVSLYERLPRDFQISPGVILPAGAEYSFLRRHYQAQTTTTRPVSLNIAYEDGAFYSGQRQQLTATLSLRPHRGWLINVGGDFNEISLREGRFTTRLWLNDVDTQFRPINSLDIR